MPPERRGLPIENAVLIAGPTASGKSAMALDLALAERGVIVNADSMQVYDVLDVLTARPDKAALAAASHRLYGHIPPSQPYSVADWLADVERLARSGAFAGRTPIFVGGTGLYFTALTLGLSDIPQAEPDVRAKWRGRLDVEGPQPLHRILAERDPATAARLQPADGQRIVRALEVLESTGRSLSEWQNERTPPLVDPASARRIVLEPDRAVLHRRIDARFEAMVAAGAVEEVRRLVALGLDPAMPAMKAIGVRELDRFISGETSLDDAMDRAKASTRQYAKRQSTWFRNQFGSQWERRV